MGIEKNAEFGKHTDATILTFGTGDISVASGRFKDSDKYKILQFAQDIPKPESEWNPPDDDIEHSSDESENIVIMLFDNVASVDVVIKKLNEVREKILNK